MVRKVPMTSTFMPWARGSGIAAASCKALIFLDLLTMNESAWWNLSRSSQYLKRNLMEPRLMALMQRPSTSNPSLSATRGSAPLCKSRSVRSHFRLSIASIHGVIPCSS